MERRSQAFQTWKISRRRLLIGNVRCENMVGFAASGRGVLHCKILARHRGFAARLRPMDCKTLSRVRTSCRIAVAASCRESFALSGQNRSGCNKKTDRAFQLGPHSGFGTWISARGALLRCPVLRPGRNIMISAQVFGNSENHSSAGSHETGSVWSDGY